MIPGMPSHQSCSPKSERAEPATETDRPQDDSCGVQAAALHNRLDALHRAPVLVLADA